jgi:rhamnose utilization protein RhaD (predicted bifunctional aldolase and dehydrogenase)
MRSRWDDEQARRSASDLDQCVYVSRTLGAESSLVLYGGGNTSVKTSMDGESVLYVKGSGSDLAEVGPSDFTPVRLGRVQELIGAEELSNDELARAVQRHVLTEQAPKPSIETLLHAVLPYRFVLHSHADSILAITNTEHGERIAGELFGDEAPSVPFRESGFALAKAAHEVYQAQATRSTIGLVLLRHGVFSFGNTARTAYDNMLELVGRAERHLECRRAWDVPADDRPMQWQPADIAALRRAVSDKAGFPLQLQWQDTPVMRAFARNPNAAAPWQHGPATPQHAVFVKRTPLFGRDLDGYAERHEREVAAHCPGQGLHELGLDPAPRVIADPDIGVWTAGVTARFASMTAEILRHDIEIMTRAGGHDRYTGLPTGALIDAEIHYGGFEARTRARYPAEECLLGEVAVLACDDPQGMLAQALSSRGAETFAPGSTDDARTIVSRAGGVDILALAPGREAWLQMLLPLLALAPRGGRLILNGPDDWCRTQRDVALRCPGLRVEALSFAAGDADRFARMCYARA